MNTIKLQLGGKERSLRFGLGVLGDIQDHLKIDMAELLSMIQKNPFKLMPVAMYYAAKYEVEKAGKMVDFTLFDVVEWIEELEGGYTNKAIDEAGICLIRSLTKNVPMLKEHIQNDDKISEEEKKRLIG